MRLHEQVAFALQSLDANRARSALIMLAMTIGIAGIVLLTWLGDCARSYVTDQFRSLGTNLVIVLPGRNETTGGAPPLLAETPQPLTLDDALAMTRSPAVRRVAPIVAGSAMVDRGGRQREAMVLGSTSELLAVRNLTMASGSFLPADDPHRAHAVCVLGGTIARELFGNDGCVGESVRLGDRRYRVIGEMASAGRSLGADLDEVVVLPVAAAQALFDAEGMFRVLIEARSRHDVARAQRDAERIVAERHDGENDVTVITQESVLATFDGILTALTMAVAGIAAISLVVAGILIMNVMVVAVAQRRSEVGLLKALGATRAAIRSVFLWEALLLSLGGGLLGVGLGEGVAVLAPRFEPLLVTGAPTWALVASFVVACGIGVGFGIAPAARAARLDPVQALARR